MSDAIEPDVFRSSHVRARKPQRCCECRRERILPGALYLRISGLWDGRWERYAMCGRCERARIALERERWDSHEELPLTHLREELRERIRDRHSKAWDWSEAT